MLLAYITFFYIHLGTTLESFIPFLLAHKNIWALHPLRNDFGVVSLWLYIILGMTLESFSPLLGDFIWTLHSLRNDFRVFSPILGDFSWALHYLRNNFGASSPLLGDFSWAMHSLRNDFRAFPYFIKTSIGLLLHCHCTQSCNNIIT